MKKRRISFNAPVILGFTLVSLLILLISLITGNRFGEFLALFKTSWASPMMYLRLFTHSVTHLTVSHFAGNIMLILAIGPMIEEKYGSRNMLFMILITSLVTGLFNLVLFPQTMLLGASGIVFMLILIASFANIQEGTIPLTVILVAIFYIGNEIIGGIFMDDNISRTSHILGGLCGGVFGYFLNRGNGKIKTD